MQNVIQQEPSIQPTCVTHSRGDRDVDASFVASPSLQANMLITSPSLIMTNFTVITSMITIIILIIITVIITTSIVAIIIFIILGFRVQVTT